MNLLDSALRYAAAGYPVFPVQGKRPLAEHGFKDASRETETIRSWWTKWPDAGIGVPTGGGSGLVVLDVDPRNGGAKSLKELEEKFGKLPPCPRVKTGGGGWHHWFSHPGGTVRTTHGFCPGLDLQSDGAYVVVPPSPHPSGGVYAWEVALDGTKLPILPPWLLKFADGGGDNRVAPPLELASDGRIPHGRHHDAVVETAASLAKRIGGLSEGGLIKAIRGALGPLLDDLASHEPEIREAARSALRKYGHPPPEPKPASDGPALFREVREALEQRYHFEQPWHAVLCALFVFQAHLARALPATFYLVIKGRYGGGKTSLLNVIGKLGGGLVFENVSVAAIARELGQGRLVCIDEFDVKRPADVQSVLDSLVRQGYRRDAAPYTRYDATKHEVERLPVYGPKALTIRSFLDPALESRGFIISAAPVEGEQAYGFVVRNLWSDVGDLPTRLARWAAQVMPGWPDSRLRAVAESAEFAAKRHRILEATGANRDTEQVLVALLVAEIACVDVTTELRAAVELRRASVGTEDAGDLEDVTEAILAATGMLQARVTEEARVLRVWFRDLKKAINGKREARKEPPINDRRLATVLTQVGVSESWKGRTDNRVRFDLPAEFVQRLRDAAPTSPTSSDIDEGSRGSRRTPTEASTAPEGLGQGRTTPPTSAPPPTPAGDAYFRPSSCNPPASVPEPASEGPPGRDAEDLLGPGPTRADRALANARRGGSVPLHSSGEGGG